MSREPNASREPSRRLFFALWPDEAMQGALAEASREALRRSDGQPVPVQNYHFTLAFLGSVVESRIEGVQAVATRVAAAFREVRQTSGARVRIGLDRIEYWKKHEILCATSTTPSADAAALSEALKQALTAEGFAPDLKPFRAHVTLARKVRRATADRTLPPIWWDFPAFHLVESQTLPSGSLYSSRAKWLLDAPAR